MQSERLFQMGNLTHRRVAILLKKPPEQRDSVEIEIVKEWLKKKSQLLNGIQADVLHDVVKHCEYMKAVTNDVIIKQGEPGKCFYVLISGRTSVYIDTEKSDNDLPPSVEYLTDDIKRKTAKKKKPSDRSQYGKFIMYFNGGDGFGEVALLGENSVRNATVIADDDSDLLVISRELFERSMKVKQEEYYEERRKFVEKCPLFNFWTPKFQRLLQMSLIKEVHKYGSVIMKQGELSKGLVFILSGHAKVVIEPAKHLIQYPGFLKPSEWNENKIKKPANRQLIQRSKSDGVTSRYIQVKRKEGYVAAEKLVMNKFIDLCYVCKNEIVGDIEMVLNLDTNIGTVIATTDTEVFVLNAKNFERLVLRKQMRTMEMLKIGVFRRLIRRMEIPKSVSIPLFGELLSLASTLIPKSDNQKLKAEESKDPKLRYLVELFLKDKVPMIEPYVQDSLYYRKKSDSKLRMTESKLLENARLNDISGNMTQKLPRSVGKLRNNVEAERELLGHQRVVQEAEVLDVEAFVRSISCCPQMFKSKSSGSLAKRPKTSESGIRITPCDAVPDDSENESGDVLDEETIVNVFQELQEIQKMKLDERLRAVYMSSLKNRLPGSRRLVCSSSENDNEEFIDWETSDKNLRHLENRIKDFCKTIKTTTCRSKESISRLKRFDVEDPQDLPIPGGAVYVHKKTCRLAKTFSCSLPHRHVRRFMLARNASSYPQLGTVNTSRISRPSTRQIDG